MLKSNRIGIKKDIITKMWPYLLIAPFFIIYLSFNFYPILYTFYISLTKWDGIRERVFVGLKNYIDIFTKDPYFLKSIGNTLSIISIYVPILHIGGLVLASVYNSKLVKHKQYFRLASFSPYLTLPVAVGLIFTLLFDWQTGIINRIMIALGITGEGVNWLGEPWLARFVIILMVVWKYTGYHMVFYNAGIVNIPPELYESAEVDGATGFQKFVHITIPLLKPIIEFLLIMDIIWSLQLFDEPLTLFKGWAAGRTKAIGGPQRSCLTAVWYLYDTSFGTQMQLGKGAAIAYGLFMFIFVFSLLGFRFFNRSSKKEESY